MRRPDIHALPHLLMTARSQHQQPRPALHPRRNRIVRRRVARMQRDQQFQRLSTPVTDPSLTKLQSLATTTPRRPLAQPHQFPAPLNPRHRRLHPPRHQQRMQRKRQIALPAPHVRRPHRLRQLGLLQQSIHNLRELVDLPPLVLRRRQNAPRQSRNPQLPPARRRRIHRRVLHPVMPQILRRQHRRPSLPEMHRRLPSLVEPQGRRPSRTLRIQMQKRRPSQIRHLTHRLRRRQILHLIPRAHPPRPRHKGLPANHHRPQINRPQIRRRRPSRLRQGRTHKRPVSKALR